MNSASFSQIVKTILTLLFIATNLVPIAFARQDLPELTAELKQKAMECRAARSDCLRACNFPSRELERGREVADADIQACRDAHAKLVPQTTPEPTWTPEYASIPDVVGVLRFGSSVNAKGRDDWKRYCRSAAIVGDGAPLNIPKGATVKVSGIRYVTNPINTFDWSKNACRADSVEVLKTP